MSDLDDEELKATRILNRADTREHRVYAIKFAVMQKQIDEKDKRIKELEKNQKQMCEEYCPKSNKIKDEEIEFQKDINRIEKDRHKKTEKSLKGQIIKNNKIIEKLEKEAQKYFEEIIKQDRVIDLMAETIRKLAISLASYRGSYNEETFNFTGNIKDIKQYFEQKSDK